VAEEFGALPGPDEEASRPWAGKYRDRHHPLLGEHLPRNLIPDWPGHTIIPSFMRDRVLPAGFRAYTRFRDAVLVAFGDTHDRARWELCNRVDDARWTNYGII
jgi:hypothetical protein